MRREKEKKKKKEWELGIGLKPLRKSILLHISKDTSKLIGRKLQFNFKKKKKGEGGADLGILYFHESR